MEEATELDPWWVTGHTDGEGSFGLNAYLQSKGPGKRPYKHVTCNYRVTLRDDDEQTLIRLQQFFGCGGLSSRCRQEMRGGEKPASVFYITNPESLLGKVVKHFDTYPLRSKKLNDYRLWRQAIVFLSKRKHDGRRLWSREEWNYITKLSAAIKCAREYRQLTLPNEASLPLEPVPTSPPYPHDVDLILAAC